MKRAHAKGDRHGSGDFLTRSDEAKRIRRFDKKKEMPSASYIGSFGHLARRETQFRVTGALPGRADRLTKSEL
jgi:hypothetical protein